MDEEDEEEDDEDDGHEDGGGWTKGKRRVSVGRVRTSRDRVADVIEAESRYRLVAFVLHVRSSPSLLQFLYMTRQKQHSALRVCDAIVSYDLA